MTMEMDMYLHRIQKQGILDRIIEKEIIHQELCVIINKSFEIYKKLGYAISDFYQGELVRMRGYLINEIADLKSQLCDLLEE